MRSSRTGLRGDAGMVTAELAAALPVLVLLLAVALSAVSVADLRVRTQDAAREAARAAARGDPDEARRLAGDVAPGASLTLSTADGDVTAVAQVHAHPLASWLPEVTVTARAVAALEPTGSGP
jgi:Flp pilus assembly protein TadG